MTAVRVIVKGRVQGVGFRAWVADEAEGRGLKGWVRNRRDGSVEALFAGGRQAVEAMVAACAGGPPAARVTAVEQYPAEPHGLAAFDVLPTA
jgi:acylphosphatase